MERRTAGHLAAQVKAATLQLPIDHPVAKRLGDLILDKLGANPCSSPSPPAAAGAAPRFEPL